MIVRVQSDRVQLITQPDHAALARRIMEQATALAGHPRRTEILHATAEHDCGWAAPDAKPNADPTTGGVVDFVQASVAVRQGTSIDGIRMLDAFPWAAALVAEHRLVVYDRFRGDPAWQAYFDEVSALRARYLELSGRSLEMLQADYAFVRLGDLISLAFCTGWTTVERFREYEVRGDGQCIVVTPDLFGGRSVPLEILARELRPPFRSDIELRAALTNAASVELRGEVIT